MTTLEDASDALVEHRSDHIDDFSERLNAYTAAHGEDIAEKMEKLIERFHTEEWPNPVRKIDMIMGMWLGTRIARGELPEEIESP